VNRPNVVGDVTISSLETIPVSEHRRLFESTSRLDTGFRNGFWKSCMMRFFYIYDYAISNNLSDIFHIEYDNLIYFDFLSKLHVFQTKPMWCVMDSPSRCIPSFLYFSNSEILARLLSVCADYAKRGANDMQALGYFRNSNVDLVGVLPIVVNYVDKIDSMYYEHAEAFGCLFDAAAIGQYVGGVDPRNIPGDTRGFINETSIIRCNRMKFEWHDKKPFLNNLPLVNLHIHSKELSRWKSY
jgi:hypothetical protein